jgi:hypothetical protein
MEHNIWVVTLWLFEKELFLAYLWNSNRTMNALARAKVSPAAYFFRGILFSLNLLCSYFVHNMSYTNGSLIASDR